jgi:hypothetical protein
MAIEAISVAGKKGTHALRLALETISNVKR